jgi:hypothetical protein
MVSVAVADPARLEDLNMWCTFICPFENLTVRYGALCVATHREHE